MVAIRDRVFERLEQHRSDAAPEDSSLADRIERATVPVQRVKVPLFRQVSLNLRYSDHRASDQHHVALIEPQVLTSLMDGDQRRGACRLDREAWAGEIELEGDASAQEILVIVDVRYACCLSGEFCVVQLCQQIARNDAATRRKNTDLPWVSDRIIARVLECFPAHLQKQALLWVHQCCIFGRVAEERRVEHLDVPQHRRSLYVTGVGKQGRGDTGCYKLLVRKENDRLDAVTQILPILFSSDRPGKSTRQTDYRDIDIQPSTVHVCPSALSRASVGKLASAHKDDQTHNSFNMHLESVFHP